MVRPPLAQVQDGAVAVVPHPAQRGGAGEHLGGADADRGAVFDVAAGRVGGMTRRPGGRRRSRGNAAAGGAVVVRVFQVPGGGALGLQQDRAWQRGEPEGAGQGAVVFEPPGQSALDPGGVVVGVTDLPVGAGEPVELAGGHRPGDLGQVAFGVRGGDPGQRPDLGVRHPPGAELDAQHGQAAQGPRDPDMFPGGPRRQLAFPGQSLGAAHLP